MRIRQIFLGKKKKANVVSIKSEEESSGEGSTLSHLLGKESEFVSICLEYKSRGQRRPHPCLPSSKEREAAVGHTLSGASPRWALLRNHRAGRPPPCFPGWGCKYPWGLWGSPSIQCAFWKIPEWAVGSTILYWVHLTLFPTFRRW